MAISLLAKRLQEIRIPQPGEKIYKDECAFSFDTPESETGLYLCMSTFLGFGRDHVERHFRKTGHAVYLHMRRLKHEIPVERGHGVEEKKVTRLAIGVEGGFDVDAGKKYEFEEINSVCVLPEFAQIPFPNAELPEKVQIAVNAILLSESASVVEAAQQASVWDGEKRIVTKHAATLLQLENGVKIPPRNWKCEQCDKVDNLWLNLTDGAVLCGRMYHDGSGGNNHAVKHYQDTGYPLAVKLGTITPESADVYSYDEDDMVEDPFLEKHLAHFGINVAQMVKTDKSMTELEIDINKRVGEWDTIQESGSQLVPLYGPGYTGISNLGNSCYLNSVVQVIFSIPDFQKRYGEYAEEIFEKAPINPNDDFNVQMAKLGRGLLSGRYSVPPPPGSDPERKANEVHNGIRPTMFKSLIGKGHVEFSTKRQQDAQEFFLHLVNVLERHSRGQPNPAECFKFQVEERVQCLGSNRIKYSHTPENLLCVPIALDAAVNKEEVLEYEKRKKEKNDGQLQIVRPRIPFSACLEMMAAPKMINDFYSEAIQGTTNALKTYRFATFPDYLMIQLAKFMFEDGWIPKKLDVSIDVPDELDLSILRGHGQQQGEELMPDSPRLQPQANEAPAFHVDEALLSNLMDMGFPLDACNRAVYNIGSNDLESAVNWLTEHIADPDFAAPFTIPGAKASDSSAGPPPDSASIDVIVSMGFNRDQAIKALKNAENNVERAIDWIFSHISELESNESKPELHLPPPPQFRDGSSRYRLVAFISHMGTSTMVGHYVCHIFKDGRWVIFNDNKVAVSENPPKDLGYLYLFQRI